MIRAELDSSTLTADGQLVSWRILVDYRSGRDTLEERINIESLILSEAHYVFATKSAMQMLENRSEISSAIREHLTQVLTEEFAVEIVIVSLDNLRFSYAFEQAIESVAIAEQEVMRAEIQRERDLIIAELEVGVALREAERLLIIAEAEAGAMIILQEFWGGITPEMRELLIRMIDED